MAPRIHCDFETRSLADLKKTGAYTYAEHPATEVYWLCYALDNDPVQSWRPGMADPTDLLDAVRAGAVVVAHNSSFEWCIWNLCLRGRYGLQWPELRGEQMDDTMSRGLVMALPAGLGDMANALGLPVAKDDAGRRLMLQMAKPKSRDLKNGSIVYFDDEERRERLRRYCVTDVEVERELDKVLPPLSAQERALWELDHRINVRGVALDVASAQSAKSVVDASMVGANAELNKLTGGEVPSVNSHAALKKWLVDNGVDALDTTAETITLLLEQVTSPNQAHIRRVLEIRRDAGKASVAKLPALLSYAASDNRAHFLLTYAGAGRTLRWAGRGPQPQNLPRPDMKQKAIEGALSLLPCAGARELIDAIYGHPITVLSSCLRSMFMAAPGRVLTASDLANIEGRVAAWIAGETWKLQAFADYDAGRGPDLYKVAFARTFGGTPEEVADDGEDRQIGKIMELFLGYEGGKGAFATGADTYGFDILEAWQEPRPGRRSIAASIVPDAIKGWRDAHPNISGFWKQLNRAAIKACQYPGETFHTDNGAISFVRRRMFLFMTLPNGRTIPYFKAEIYQGKYGEALRYYGTDSKTKQWCLIDTYGGKLFENAVQAVARDIFGGGLLRAEKAGMPIVLHIHDAAVTEHRPSEYTAADLSRVLCDVGPKYHGLPVSAKGYTGTRFQK